MRTKAGAHLELEAGDLDHQEPVLGDGPRRAPRARFRYFPAPRSSAPRFVPCCAEELNRRALPVGAGDRDRSGASRHGEPKLDLGRDLESRAARPRGRAGGRRARPGLVTTRSQPSSAEGCPWSRSATSIPLALEVRASWPEPPRVVRRSIARTVAPCLRSSRAAAEPLGATPTTRACRPGEPWSALSVLRHCSFSVLRPTRAASAAAIQNRTTTRGSFQPESSKW